MFQPTINNMNSKSHQPHVGRKVTLITLAFFFSFSVFSQVGISSSSADAASQEKIDAWKQRGGSVGSSMWGVGVSYMEMSDEFFTMIGTGFNGAFGFGGVSLSLPVDNQGNFNNWFATKYEIGAEFSYFETEVSSTDGSFSSITSTQQQLNIPFNLGVGMGVGKGTGMQWKGVVLYANWSPSYQMIFPEEGEQSEVFNASGFSFDIEFTTLEAAVGKLVKKPQTRLSFFFLPQTDDTPLFFSFSIRRVVY